MFDPWTILLILSVSGGMGLLAWRLSQSVDRSMQPGETWILRDESRPAPPPHNQDVEILYREGGWVKFQGKENGNVWSLTTEAFWSQYRHSSKDNK